MAVRLPPASGPVTLAPTFRTFRTFRTLRCPGTPAMSLNLRTRLALGFFAPVAILLAVAAYHLVLIERLEENNLSLAREDLATISSSLSLWQELNDHDELSQRFLILREAGYASALSQERVAIGDDLSELAELAHPDDFAGSETMRRWRDYALAAEDHAPAVLAGGSAQDYERVVLPELRAIADSVRELIPATRARITRRAAESVSQAENARLVAWISGLLGIGVAAALATWLSGALSAPLQRLITGTEQVAQGHWDHRIETASIPIPEIATLAADFNVMAEKLGQLDQLKSDFVTSVSHDLKAPLASMEDTLQIVLDGSIGDLSAKQRHMLELNLGACRRLRQMIGDLLDLARLESGSIVTERRPVDLDAIVDTALAGLQPVLVQKRLTVRRERLESATVQGDGPLLVQLVTNLLTNAIQASPEDESVHVSVTSGDDDPAQHVRLLVEDHGPGIPEADRQKIFDRFERGSTGGRAGTGLGLTIARTIVEAHEGRIWIEDAVSLAGGTADDTEPSGGGARLVVSLPAAAQAADHQVASATGHQSAVALP